MWIEESQLHNFVLSQTFDEEENISSSEHLKLFFFAGSQEFVGYGVERRNRTF